MNADYHRRDLAVHRTAGYRHGQRCTARLANCFAVTGPFYDLDDDVAGGELVELDELEGLESEEELFDSVPVDFDSDAAGFASPPLVFSFDSLASLPSAPLRA